MAVKVDLGDGRTGELGSCKSCGQRVVWARTAAGKAAPYTFLDDNTLKRDDKGKPFSHFGDCKDSRGWSGKSRADADAPTAAADSSVEGAQGVSRSAAAGGNVRGGTAISDSLPPAELSTRCANGGRDDTREGWYCLCGAAVGSAQALKRHILG